MENSNTKNKPVFHYTLHQKLWNILANNPGMYKDEALKTFFTEEEKEAFGGNDCVACIYMKAVYEYRDESICNARISKDGCEECPLDYSNVKVDEFMEHIYKVRPSYCLKKLFGAWVTTAYALKTKKYPNYTFATYLHDSNGNEYSEEELKELCSKYAKMIADLPVKEGIEYI